MSVQLWWSDTGGKKLKYVESNLTQCSLIITDASETGLELSPGFHSERPETNFLSCGMAETTVPV